MTKPEKNPILKKNLKKLNWPKYSLPLKSAKTAIKQRELDQKYPNISTEWPLVPKYKSKIPQNLAKTPNPRPYVRLST